MTVKLHFYGSDTMMRKLVCFRLASSWGHVAVQINNRVFEAGYSYGVREISTAEMCVPTETIDLNCTEEETKLAWEIAKCHVGSGYDKLSIIGFFLGMKWQNDKQLFCSEYAREILEAAFGIDMAQDELYTPGDIYYFTKGLMVKRT